jgi:type III pantothenate kinase
VVRGIRYEIEGYIRTLQKRVKHFETYMTGGGAAYLQTVMRQNTILEKHLVLIGLNRILLYNLKPSETGIK